MSTTAADPRVATTEPRRSRLQRMAPTREFLARTAGAVLSGVLMWASFPPRDLWFLAIASLAVLFATLSTGRISAAMGAWVGFAFGLSFFLPLLPWIGVYVGPLPWVALSVVLAVYYALFGAVATTVMRLRAAPVWFAASWVTVEWARSAFPFGGFPWGRAAFSQIGSPLLPVAALFGVPGLSFAVALTGAGLASLIAVLVLRRRRDQPLVRVGAITAVIATLAGPICAAIMWAPVHHANHSDDTITVAAIQGNVPRLGLDFNAQRRAVLDNHIRETLALADRINSGQATRPDIVIWPENSSDIDPTVNSDAADEISGASEAVGAPIMVGTLVDGEPGPTNSVLVWDGARGPIARYDKQIIQPFGEYLPMRSFFRLFSSYADQAGHFQPGHGPGVVSVPITGRDPVTVGISTCWEVAFDRSARKSVDHGAQFLSVPTNNATFGRTEMTYQQLAMSQVRAVEHGRAVVVAATTGVSAVVSPDGSTSSRSGFFVPAMLEAEIPLHTDKTISDVLGQIPEIVVVVCTLAGLLTVIGLRLRTRRSSHDDHTDPPGTAASGSTAPGSRAQHATAKEFDGSRD
ncbi:hypothetical protein GCM10027169_38770 [Gordonia jinhuaensis]|uniref:Apolipoprotein N-acyltransferase n=2 Tax=Gordonia jinhuaensis TaxID=1517702 RepID=A0A916T159_9ACTN|nr:hypothetical protein GCM10011489_10400 [Gordonia jinhuaensis]